MQLKFSEVCRRLARGVCAIGEEEYKVMWQKNGDPGCTGRHQSGQPAPHAQNQWRCKTKSFEGISATLINWKQINRSKA